MANGRSWLILAGWLSVAASLLHLGCIVGGGDWYRFFGAGEPMALAAERGEIWPHLITLAIAALLAIWAAYAFSGAGVLRRLPLLRTGLVVITLIYLARGLVIVPLVVRQPAAATPFDYWSSVIVLGYGLAYAIGTWATWPALRTRIAA
jgi:hypothetical protein